MRATRIRAALIAVLVTGAAAVSTVLTTDAIAVDLPAGSALSDDGQGTLSIEARDQDSGDLLPVRVRVASVRPWREDRTLVDRQGTLVTKLPAGRYRIYVTHGPEWSVVEQTVELESGLRTQLQARLRREVDASQYTSCDLHVHTAESPDSNLSLAARVDTLLAEDVQFAVLTDHNRVTDAVAALRSVGIGSWPGVEVTTWDPELGHFNVFPATHAPRFRHPSAQRLLHELRANPDSFVQINHPRLEGHIGYFELAAFERATGKGTRDFPLAFDGIEVWNGYDLASPVRRHEVFLDWLAMVARGQHITATGNSDSHRAGLAPHVGYPRTYVQVPRAQATQPGKVLAALKQGRAFVSNGPIVTLRVRGKLPGDTLHVTRNERSLSVRVQVAAPAWMDLSQVELWLGQERAAVLPLTMRQGRSGALASVVAELPLADERSLVATVHGRASMKPLLGRSSITPHAFTNPVWIVRQ